MNMQRLESRQGMCFIRFTDLKISFKLDPSGVAVEDTIGPDRRADRVVDSENIPSVEDSLAST
ncbi:unnamed protein product [Somion occarium]|uniref:Uncharacterized protein n=1 Tax=Somion occarium TaxID=3059160 RepID=A0ABP1DQV1_9APHY